MAGLRRRWIFIDFDSQLNDEERLVRQTARQFVENEIIPIIEKAQPWKATFPETLGAATRRNLVFFGAKPCTGTVCAGHVQRRVRTDDPGTRTRRPAACAVFVSVQGALVMYPIYTYGSDAAKKKISGSRFLQQGKSPSAASA